MVKFKSKKSKEDRLDCESIISTYSNLYNRPTVIREKVIELSKKSGMPLGVLENKPKSENQLNKIEHKIIRILPEFPERKRDETKEEKKARKNAIKEYKRERRVEKKINKLAFKSETAAQNKIIKNETTNYVKLC